MAAHPVPGAITPQPARSLMTTHSNLRTGGQILADQLQIHGVDMAFGVPGESYLGLLDALYDTAIRYVICRQEGGAAMMAEAYGKLTGRPGIAMVTRGPGATNASPGVHIARQEFDADDPPGRPGGARDARPRGVPGDRLPADVRQHRQMGARDRRPGAHPGGDQPRLPHRDRGATGAGGDRPARGCAGRDGGLRGRRPLPGEPAAPGRGRHERTCARCWQRRSGRSWCWAAAAGTRRPQPTSRRSPSASICRSACRSGARTISTTATPAMPAMSASRWRRRSATGCGMRMC